MYISQISDFTAQTVPTWTKQSEWRNKTMKRKLSKRLLSLVLSGMLVMTGLEVTPVYAAEESATQEAPAGNIALESETQTETALETVSSGTAAESEVLSSMDTSGETAGEPVSETTQESSKDSASETTEENEEPQETMESTESTWQEPSAEEETAEQTTEQTIEEQQTADASETESVLVVNPLYDGIIDTNTLLAESEQRIHLFSDSARTSSFQSMEEAAAYLRDQMAARETTVSVQIPMTLVTANGGMQAVPGIIFDNAIAHTESCSGQAGDALAAGYLSYKASMSSSGGAAIFTYTISYFTTAEQEQQLTQKVSEIMDKLALTGKTDYQKAKAVHDYICDNVTYDKSLSKYSAYDALCTGSAVCQGYAVSFYRLCKEAGLSVRIITGKGNGGAHAWNIVKIQDDARAAGKYYNVDCTWDSQESGTLHLYFLVSEADFGDHVRNEEYNTSEFHAQYPMAESSYIDDSSLEAGLNKENPQVSFTTLEDKTVSSAAAGKPRLIIFFRTTCGNSQRTVKAISEYKFPNTDIYAAEIDGKNKAEVTTFKNTYGSDTITFLYDTAGNNNMSLFRYAQAAGITSGNQMNVSLPVLCYIDASNMLQCVTQGVQNASQVEKNLSHYCGGPAAGQYTITYVLDGGTNHSGNPAKFKETSGIITLEAPVKDGYTFAGWYLDAALTQKISQIDSSIAHDITLYAKWTPILATDALNCDNFERYFQTIDDEEVSSMAEGRPKLLVFFSRNCGLSRQTIKDIATNGVPNADIIALETTKGTKEEVRSFKNTYGSDAITFAYDQYGVLYNSYANEYVDRSGIDNYSTIIICYIDASNKYQHITFGTSSASAVKTNIDRYCGSAGEPSPSETYTITYELNGGTNDPANPATYTAATETFVLKAPSKEGDVFDGWYLDAALTQPIRQVEKGSSGNLTVYAKWKNSTPAPDDPAPPETYTITYELGGGTNNTSNPSSYTAETETIILQAPSKNGFVFDGWYLDAAFTQPVTQIEKGRTGNLTLYAKWLPAAGFTVTFDTQGHGTAPQPYTNIKEGALIQKPADPAAEGYVFGGWYQESECKTIWNFEKDKVTADLTLYAKWTENSKPDDKPTPAPEPDKDDTYYGDNRTDLKDLGAVAADIKPAVYDANKPYSPTVKVTIPDGKKKITLTEGTDYRVSYENNDKAGTATAIVRGNGIYKGELVKEYTITKKPLSKLSVITGGMAASEASAGGTHALPVRIYDGMKQISPSDYTVSSFVVNKKKTSATVILSATGNSSYKDTVKASITLYTADAGKIINPENVTLNKYTAPYTGKAVKDIEPVVTLNGETLVKNKHYKVQYKNNTKAGTNTALVIVTGKGQYKGKVVVPFTITASNSPLAVTSKISDKTYSGKPLKPSVTVKAGTKKLKVNTDYTVKYSDNVHAGTATITITGIGNYAGSAPVTTTFTIKSQKISKASVKGTVSKGITLTYNKKPLVEGVDYKLACGAEKKGKTHVTITGIGDFTQTNTKYIKN